MEVNYINSTQVFKSYTVPDLCPICKKHIAPTPIIASDCDFFDTEVIFKCTNLRCNHLFISTYTLSDNLNEHYSVYKDSKPIASVGISKDENINNLSERFYQIYQESSDAELFGLNEISGMGYRKALEFLIRDYCIYKYPSKIDSIKNTKQIGTVIENFIDNSNIKDMAKRATWLGNDETHYDREWIEMTIEDLKCLIDLTLHWIIYDLKTEEMKKRMPKKEKK
ncbi:hypothetical protein ACN9JY_00210 [Aliarcobacter butzleri]|uniref:hypothetical protein n=1 Tax=Aliarcobacter butzleri TaxID=28197 RepID=UPI003B213376